MGTDVDEPVSVRAYDARWPGDFATEAARIAAALPGFDARIEHIGSTAVAGMAAKPVIDVLVGVDESHVADAAARIAGLGYEDLGAAGVPGRRHLRVRSQPAYNVHVFARASPLVADNLVLRDFLRAHPSEARAYAELKQRVVADGHGMLLRYSDAKRAAVTALLERARAWAAEARTGR